MYIVGFVVLAVVFFAVVAADDDGDDDHEEEDDDVCCGCARQGKSSSVSRRRLRCRVGVESHSTEVHSSGGNSSRDAAGHRRGDRNYCTTRKESTMKQLFTQTC